MLAVGSLLVVGAVAGFVIEIMAWTHHMRVTSP